MSTGIGDRSATTKFIQELLKALGYSPGPIDSIFGRKTESAVKAFQSDYKLPITGVADVRTKELMLGVRSGSYKKVLPYSSGYAKQITSKYVEDTTGAMQGKLFGVPVPYVIVGSVFIIGLSAYMLRK